MLSHSHLAASHFKSMSWCPKVPLVTSLFEPALSLPIIPCRDDTWSEIPTHKWNEFTPTDWHMYICWSIPTDCLSTLKPSWFLRYIVSTTMRHKATGTQGPCRGLSLQHLIESTLYFSLSPSLCLCIFNYIYIYHHISICMIIYTYTYVYTYASHASI